MIEFLVKRKDLDSKYFVVGNQQAIDKIQTCLIEYSKCISHGFDIINFYIKNICVCITAVLIILNDSLLILFES